MDALMEINDEASLESFVLCLWMVWICAIVSFEMKVREMRAWVVLGEWVLVKDDVVMDVVNADACLIEGVYVGECLVEEVKLVLLF